MLAVASLLAMVPVLSAQRVQVPDYGAAPQTFAAPQTLGAPQNFGAPQVFGAPSTFAAPPAAGGATAVYGSPSGAGFDPYALPGVGAPQSSMPYTISPGVPLEGYPAAPATVSPYGVSPYGAAPPGAPSYGAGGSAGWDVNNPFAWEKGTYGFEAADGSTVRWKQFLQAIAVEHTFINGSGGRDSLGVNRLELSSTVAFPLGYNIDAPLLLTPGFAFNWLDGPSTVPLGMSPGADLPPRVYDAYLDAAWFPQPTQALGAELGVRTGVWTDFNEVTSDSVRIMGRGLARLSIAPNMEILVGVVYLDRLRVKLLPAGGIRVRPNELWDFDLVFPNPRIRRRLPSVGATDWRWITAGEYGGGSWTIKRLAPVGGDQFDYNDIRFTTGLEWETQHQVTGHLEVGVAFDRELVYRSSMPERHKLDTTFLFRGGVQF